MKAARLAPLAGILLWLLAFLTLRLASSDAPDRASDLETYFIPALALIRDSLLEGELPLWNPYQFVGSPFLALHQPGVLYPLLLVFAWLPPHWAIVAHVLSHVALVGLFTQLLARRIGLDGFGALAASLAFMGSVQVVHAAVLNTAYLSTFVWLPAVLWATRRGLEEPRAGKVAVFAMVVALAFLGGFAQGFFYIAQAGLLYALYGLLTQQPRPELGRVVLVLGGGALLGVGLMSAQLLPTFEHALSATRSLEGLSIEQAGLYGLPSEEVLPAFVGRGSPWLGFSFLLLPLGALALLRRAARREALFFLLLFLLALDYMRGTHGFVFPLAYRAPLGDTFRVPLRIGFVTDFAAAMLLGAGTAAAVDWLRRRRSSAAALVGVVLCGLIGVEAFLRHPPSRRFHPLVAPESISAPAELVDLAASRGFDRSFLVGPPRKYGTLHGIPMLPDYEPMLPGLYADYFSIPPRQIWHGYVQVDRPPPRKARWLLQEPERMDLLSVRYYVDRRPEERRRRHPLAPQLQSEAGALGSSTLFEREQALPRAYVVHELWSADSDGQALAWLRDERFNARTTAVVSGEAPFLEPRKEGAEEQARIVAYGLQRVEVEATCGSRCLLVLTDLYDPSWVVRVDGEEGALIRTNFLLRGVPLDAGSWRVVFEYRPRAFYLGAGVSLLSLLVLLGIAGSSLRSRRAARAFHGASAPVR